MTVLPSELVRITLAANLYTVITRRSLDIHRSGIVSPKRAIGIPNFQPGCHASCMRDREDCNTRTKDRCYRNQTLHINHSFIVFARILYHYYTFCQSHCIHLTFYRITCIAICLFLSFVLSSLACVFRSYRSFYIMKFWKISFKPFTTHPFRAKIMVVACIAVPCAQFAEYSDGLLGLR